MDDYDEAVLFTFALLESRLARLEYLLSGPRAPEGKPQTVADRIHRIEQTLQQLAGKTALLDNVNELLTKHKDVLMAKPEEPSVPLSTPQKALLVVERATSFATTASQLKALDDQPVPATAGFVKLAALRPRIAEAEDRHLQQALKIAELRRRTGLLVQRDKQVHWVAAGRAWAGYQERLVRGYKGLQREEGRLRAEREDGEGETLALLVRTLDGLDTIPSRLTDSAAPLALDARASVCRATRAHAELAPAYIAALPRPDALLARPSLD
ncbi:hypothetical protein C7974DRAFT_407899 [Boeremia exigua]|uniref:uncharacterized protein n=1 Tax=Boeremia exigua TaxID=749465 RepID=UPI001E8E19BF|nr:uncharacterized protein C7974DRAFT_407899 [Boeremia exigua]KAH6644202.1 hypothetical protein C7974DRAFT_407899 [Boeremia exigua]